MSVIAVEGVSKRYGKQAVLNNVSFAVETGRIAAIVGKNGCGKSTLLSILAGLLAPDAGRVLFDGADPARDPRLRRYIGFVAQGDCLFDELSVWDNLVFWASAAGLGKQALRQNPYVDLLGVGEFFKKRVARLSGGMRRRVAICAALLGNPAYLLLDEPFTGLDLVYKQELSERLRGLGAMGKTLLYTTHSGEEVANLSDCTLLLSGGEIILYQNTQDFYATAVPIQQTLINLLKGEQQL